MRVGRLDLARSPRAPRLAGASRPLGSKHSSSKSSSKRIHDLRGGASEAGGQRATPNAPGQRDCFSCGLSCVPAYDHAAIRCSPPAGACALAAKQRKTPIKGRPSQERVTSSEQVRSHDDAPRVMSTLLLPSVNRAVLRSALLHRPARAAVAHHWKRSSRALRGQSPSHASQDRARAAAPPPTDGHARPASQATAAFR